MHRSQAWVVIVNSDLRNADGRPKMVERQYYCIGCQVTRRAKVWYRWIGVKDSPHSRWWLCDKCHATLPRKCAAMWEPYRLAKLYPITTGLTGFN